MDGAALDAWADAVAQKRGVAVAVYAVRWRADGACSRPHPLRRKIERQVAEVGQRAPDHLCRAGGQTQQVWQWVRREPGKPPPPRAHYFAAASRARRCCRSWSGLAFSLEDEGRLTLVDVTGARAGGLRRRAGHQDVLRPSSRTSTDAFLKFIEGIPDDGDRAGMRR